METKSNGTAKKVNATVKKEVQKKLTEEAIGKTVVPEKIKAVVNPTINLDDRIQKFENRSHMLPGRTHFCFFYTALKKGKIWKSPRNTCYDTIFS